MIKNKHISGKSGFTIVELLVVIVVIGILATIGLIQYTGMQDRAREAVLRSDLTSAAEILNIDQVRTGSYPEEMSEADRGNGLPASVDTEYQYTPNNSAEPPTFCLTGINGMVALHITQEGVVNEGTCEGDHGPIAGGGEGGGGGAIVDGSYLQDITSENCPAERTRAVDARDSHTYWVQEMSDGRCWMLTNLAYSGGGDNTYGDVRSLQDGTGDYSDTYLEPKYYVPTEANPTVEPDSPSMSTDGGVTSPQYGYLYNWCGAMGGQSTAACNTTGVPAPEVSVSVCPAGWRLPTGRTGGEFYNLFSAVNSSPYAGDAGLRSSWLAQRSGDWWRGVFSLGGDTGFFWASTLYSPGVADMMHFDEWSSHPDVSTGHSSGFAVRCIAA